MGKKRTSDGFGDEMVYEDDDENNVSNEEEQPLIADTIEEGRLAPEDLIRREKRSKLQTQVEREEDVSKQLHLDEISGEQGQKARELQKQRDLYEAAGQYDRVAEIDEALDLLDVATRAAVREVQVAYAVPWLKRVSGTIQSKLEEGYVADELVPEEVKYRVLTYVEGALGVDSELTLSVEKNPDGTPKRSGAKVKTLHGWLEQTVLQNAQSGLYVETTIQVNTDLLKELEETYKVELEELFSRERYLLFEPKQRKDLTELL